MPRIEVLPRRLTEKELSNLESSFKDRLSDPNCLPFINELLATVEELDPSNPPFNRDIMKVFEAINNSAKGGYTFDPLYGVNTVEGNIQYNPRVLLMPRSSYGPASSLDREAYIAGQIEGAAFHETFHLNGKNSQVSDVILAQAILKMSPSHGWAVPTASEQARMLKSDLVSSFFWGARLEENCRPFSKRSAPRRKGK